MQMIQILRILLFLWIRIFSSDWQQAIIIIEKKIPNNFRNKKLQKIIYKYLGDVQVFSKHTSKQKYTVQFKS